jgi:sulfate transport system substrate-binding protein
MVLMFELSKLLRLLPAYALSYFCLICVLAFTCGCSQGDKGDSTNSDVKSDGTISLLNVSYDPTREFYSDYNKLFAKHFFEKTGHKVVIQQSHGGSGKQARSVLDGLRADIVTLALAYDVDVLVDHGLVNSQWQKRLPADASPYTSAIVFLVRKGNPKKILNWDDLLRSDVKVITPNPKTSGGARWNFLAMWGYLTIELGKSESEAFDYMKRLFKNVPVLDSGARGATTTFVQKEIGDVFLTWENEALLALKEYGASKLEIIYPPVSILAQPVVAVVDKNVNQRPEIARKAAEEYLAYLYSDEAQKLIAEHGYRPVNTNILKDYRWKFPEIKMFTISQIAGDWRTAQKKFFEENGLFDKIFQN